MTDWIKTAVARAPRARPELIIDKPIGAATALRKQLAPLIGAKEIVVHLNTDRGDVQAAISAHHALRSHPSNVVVHVDGFCGVAASLVAAAGDVVKMPVGSFLLIGPPESHSKRHIRAGEMRRVAAHLEQLESAMVSIWHAKCHAGIERLRQMMEARTLLGAQQAVDLGLADQVVRGMRAVAIDTSAIVTRVEVEVPEPTPQPSLHDRCWAAFHKRHGVGK